MKELIKVVRRNTDYDKNQDQKASSTGGRHRSLIELSYIEWMKWSITEIKKQRKFCYS